MATASDQLARLLSLVPWLRAHPGVSKAEAAAAFSISVDQLEKDLQLAFTCELPGQPEVFIDIDYLDSDRVSVIDAGSIDRPLRLRADEAVSLLVGLRSLAAVPGLADREALDSALAKIEDAAARVGVGLGPDTTALRAGAAAAAGVDPVAAIRDRPGPGPAGAPGVLGAQPGRGDRAGRGPVPGVHRRRHGLPRGVLPLLRGRPHLPAGPGDARRGPARAGDGARSPSRTGSESRRPSSTRPTWTPWSSSTSTRRRAGCPSTTPASGSSRWRTAPEGSLRVALRTADPRLVGPPRPAPGGRREGGRAPGCGGDVRRAADEALVAYGVSSTADGGRGFKV